MENKSDRAHIIKERQEAQKEKERIFIEPQINEFSKKGAHTKTFFKMKRTETKGAHLSKIDRKI